MALVPAPGYAQRRPSTGVFDQTAGLTYRTAAGTGSTNATGEFPLPAQGDVTFGVGDVVLGSVSPGATPPARFTPAHLVADVGGDVRKIGNQRVTNIARFVQSLDQDGNVDNGVTISRQASDLVSRRKAIDFDRTEAAFAADPAIVALFAELKMPLRTGPQARNHLRRTLLGIRKLSNVRIPTRDSQVQLLADLFLPIEPGKYPVVLTATKYGKTFGRGCACTPADAIDAEKAEDEYFETEPNKRPRPNEVSVMPNTVDWVPQGYALVRVDGRGSCQTPGLLHPYSAQEAEDTYDAIEWAGTQAWSNGNVGMWGLSFSASTQLPVASLQPPHLKAIIPHSGDLDQYRDIVYQGGLYYKDYRENWFRDRVAGSAMRCLDQPFTSIIDIFKQNPFDDPRVYGPYAKDPKTGEQLPIGPVSPNPAKLTLPMWSHMRQDVWPIHIRGGSEVYIQAASKNKKLWVEAGHEYVRAFDCETLALHVKFFDYWLKGVKNDIMDEPPVRLDVRLPRDAENPNGGWKTRFEKRVAARPHAVRQVLPRRHESVRRRPPADEAACRGAIDHLLSRRRVRQGSPDDVLGAGRLLRLRSADGGYRAGGVHEARPPRVVDERRHGHLRHAARDGRERKGRAVPLDHVRGVAGDARLPQGLAPEARREALDRLSARAHAHAVRLSAARAQREGAGRGRAVAEHRLHPEGPPPADHVAAARRMLRGR